MFINTQVPPKVANYKKLRTNFHKFLPRQSIYALYPDLWQFDTIDANAKPTYYLRFLNAEVYTVNWNLEASFSMSDGELCEIEYSTPSYDSMESRKYFERILDYISNVSKEKLIKSPDDITHHIFSDSLRSYGLMTTLYALTAYFIVDINERDLLRMIVYCRRLGGDNGYIKLVNYPRRLMSDFIIRKVDHLIKANTR